MGTTLDAINSRSGVRLIYTAVIEGFSYILTDGDPGVALLAYSECNTTPYATDFTQAIGGLSVDMDVHQMVSPWKPFTEPTIIRLSVVPAETDSSATVSDVVGETVFRRVPTTYTELNANLDCNDTTVTGKRVDDFAASGTIHLGPEAIAYSSRDTGADTFTVSTRGRYSPFLTSGGTRFARTHKPLTASEHELGLSPVITSEPVSWKGRWVAVWVHRVVGGTIDTVESDQSSAHLLFAGTVSDIDDQDGATIFTCTDLRERIYSTRINRDPWRARIKDGVYLTTGQRFTVTTTRQVSGGGTTVGNGNDLVVVSAGASGTNQVNAGTYTAIEIADKISAWIQGERAASRTLFNAAFIGNWPSGTDGTRTRFQVTDPTSTSGLSRRFVVTFPSPYISRFLGWNGDDAEVSGANQSIDRNSPAPPLRFLLDAHQTQGVTLVEARGTWISQQALLPVSLRDPVVGWDGVARVGDLGYVRVKYTSDTSVTITGSGTEAWFPGQSGQLQGLGSYITVDDDVSLDLSQVLVLYSSFSGLFLRMLLSTGTASFNNATYDNLSEAISCGIPYTAIGGADFISDVTNLDGAGAPLTALVDGPVNFHELFKEEMILRRCFFVWAAGRLRLKSWSSPTSAYATVALTEASKASPSGSVDMNRAAAQDSGDYYNIVKMWVNRDADGNYRDNLIFKDAHSIRAHGERALELKLRNTFREVGDVGTQLDDLIADFSGFFPFTSRPWIVIKRTIDQNQVEQVYPGIVLTLTDKYIRDPATGKRYSNTLASGGLSGYPALCIGTQWDLGGTEGTTAPSVRPPFGEATFMVSPQATIPTYVPCAEVDETTANAGYTAGTKTLVCKAHAHSESSAVADATRFVAGDEVLVIQIDPSNPAAAQSWSDVVASQTGNNIVLTTGLAGYDTTGATLYRVIYDAYGTVGSSQKTKAYQADDADGLIVNAAQAYAFGVFGTSQSSPYTAAASTELPARYATNYYGDGQPLDTGSERDAVRLANNGIDYKWALQQPTMYSEVRDFTGGGTWQMVECQPIFVRMGDFTAGLSCLLSMAPRMRSTSGATASVRLTLSRRRPTGSTRDDVTFVGPYIQVTFTATSTTYAVSTAQTVDVAHVKRSDTAIGGVGWLTVEIKTATEMTGIARLKMGAAA